MTPNGIVKLLHGVPLDSSYKHTVRFTSWTNQRNAFDNNTYVKYTFTKQSYQRVSRNRIRLHQSVDNVRDCNYMMFQNNSVWSGGTDTETKSKWFYAFIDKCEYINENTCELEYTIDVIQTWYFDYTVPPCFVEREHSETDNIIENLIPEEINVNEVIPEDISTHYYNTNNNVSDMTLIIFYVPNDKSIELESSAGGINKYRAVSCDIPDPNHSGYTLSNRGTVFNGVYAGCLYYGLHISGNMSNFVTNVSNLVKTMTDNQCTIINMTQVPYSIWQSWINTGSPKTDTKILSLTSGFKDPKNRQSPYIPKNKKLYTYPYRKIIVSNSTGQSAEFRWEYFNLVSPEEHPIQAKFNLYGIPLFLPEIICYPQNYRNIADDYESGLILNDFPFPPWNEDSFSEWWSQNKTSYIMGVLTSILQVAGGVTMLALAPETAGLSTFAGMGLAASGSSGVFNSIGNIADKYNTPDQAKGQFSTSCLKTSQNRNGFIFYDMGVERDLAISIDNYFSLYGYATKQVKIPNIYRSTAHLRAHWNYLKTQGALVKPKSTTYYGMDAGSARKIESILDNGITFWNSISEVGDYSLTNSTT